MYRPGSFGGPPRRDEGRSGASFRHESFERTRFDLGDGHVDSTSRSPSAEDGYSSDSSEDEQRPPADIVQRRDSRDGRQPRAPVIPREPGRRDTNDLYLRRSHSPPRRNAGQVDGETYQSSRLRSPRAASGETKTSATGNIHSARPSPTPSDSSATASSPGPAAVARMLMSLNNAPGDYTRTPQTTANPAPRERWVPLPPPERASSQATLTGSGSSHPGDVSSSGVSSRAHKGNAPRQSHAMPPPVPLARPQYMYAPLPRHLGPAHAVYATPPAHGHAPIGPAPQVLPLPGAPMVYRLPPGYAVAYTAGPLPPPPAKNNDTYNPKFPRCEICTRSFRTKTEWEAHIREHYKDSKSAPFKCDYCDLRYKYTCNRTQHVKRDHPEAA